MEDREDLDKIVNEIRTQTGMVVLLMLLNLFTVIFCVAAVWYGMVEKS
jgi:hypothetical protein